MVSQMFHTLQILLIQSFTKIVLSCQNWLLILLMITFGVLSTVIIIWISYLDLIIFVYFQTQNIQQPVPEYQQNITFWGEFSIEI